jgi:hypothetical protein
MNVARSLAEYAPIARDAQQVRARARGSALSWSPLADAHEIRCVHLHGKSLAGYPPCPPQLRERGQLRRNRASAARGNPFSGHVSDASASSAFDRRVIQRELVLDPSHGHCERTQR